MRKLLIALAALSVIAPAALQAEDSEPVSWLFIQHAASMQFDGETLTLSGLAPSVTAFSDRPHRRIAPLHAEDYLALWHAGADDFTADPPNAGLSVLVDGQMQTAVVELTDPVLDGSTLRYKVIVLEGAVPPQGEVPSLFVDAFPTAVNDQITDAVTQANVDVVGDSPAIAMGNIYEATAQALSNAEDNATGAQQQATTP